MNRFILATSLFILHLHLLCDAQTRSTAGGYAIRHYGVKSFGMHPRNFYIAQDKHEFLYFGNAYGVIEHDGKTWRSINLPNGNSGLALALAKNGTVYVGGFNEVGYLQSDESGVMNYKTLNYKLPADKQFNRDIQKIEECESGILFHTELGLHLYRNDTFITVKPTAKGHLFSYVQKIANKIYVQETGKGLLRLNNDQLELLPGGELLATHAIKEILSLPDGRLLIAENNSITILDHNRLIPLAGNANQILHQQQITHAMHLPDHQLLITTYNNGFYIVSESGDVVRHVCIANGLPDNTINYAFIDKRGGLWLALDNGIAYLEINTPFLFIGNHSGIQGMGYAAAVFQGKLYLGTSQGLFYAEANDTEEKKFYPVKGITGQIWDLAVIDHTLLCCQNNHTYQIANEQASLIPGSYEDEGHWKMAPLKNHAGYAIKGTYLGFQLYKLEQGKWKFVRKLSGFEESCRIFEQDEQGTIWMCHGNNGIYKIKLSDDLTKIYSAENSSVLNGFRQDCFNYISNINHHIVFAADEGVYFYDENKHTFVKDKPLEKIIGENKFVSRIVQYNDSNIWLFTEEDINLYRYKTSGQYTAEENVFRKIAGELVGSYEFVFPVSTHLAIIGSQEGFIFFNLKANIEKRTAYQVSIRKVEANFKNDSLLYGGTKNSASKLLTLSYDFNALRITYAATFYENPEKLKYQYALTSTSGTVIQWSGWTTNTQVDLSNLFEGLYTFHVRSKNIYEQLSEECTYTFVILPPWYRAWWAYTIYAIAIAIGAWMFYRYIRIRFQKQKEKLDLQKQKELMLLEQKHITENLQTEKELIALRNAKLEADMVLKNNELASLATTVTQKTEFLSQLKDKLEHLHKDNDSGGQQTFKEVIKTIDQDLDFDDNWAKFQIHFDELHHNFLHRLRANYPKLNPSWLLLCAYIRMNKSNKEIAALMNISLAGVEKRKYRLREKIGLESEDRLSDFISHF